jgi:hypothetical protein
MFNKNIDDRLSSWSEHRTSIETSENPFEEVWNFWKSAPYIAYNNKIDPYFQFGWPNPWDIIVHNKYDDFTKAVMIGWTLKLTKRFQNSKIEIRTLVDNEQRLQYNVVYVNEEWAINYNDNGPVLAKDIPESFITENLVVLSGLR